MLKVTHDAATLLASSRASSGHPETFGVRFFVTEVPGEGKAQLAFEFVPDPRPQDQVAEQEGLSVYVAPELSEALGEATIDAQEAGSGKQLILRR